MDRAPSAVLVERMCAGDEDALEQLLSKHLPALRAFVRLRSDRTLRARESTSDLVQSVCREVLTHLDRFQHPSEAGFRQWLYTTALRKIQNRYAHYHAQKRDAAREVALDLDAGDAPGTLACYASFATPSQDVAAREEVERIEAAFDKLPDDYRTVISLSRVVGLSHAEIAQQMERTEGAVRTLLSRALARLAELLDQA